MSVEDFPAAPKWIFRFIAAIYRRAPTSVVLSMAIRWHDACDAQRKHHGGKDDLTLVPPSRILRAMRVGRRLATVVATLSLCGGNLGVCAGWQPMPQQRLACCSAEAGCPMHQSESHSPTSGSHHAVSQAQADRCCAGSERNDSATSSVAFVLSGSLTLSPSPVPVVLPIITFRLERWRAAVPLRPSPVPKHLLLSVFLV